MSLVPLIYSAFYKIQRLVENRVVGYLLDSCPDIDSLIYFGYHIHLLSAWSSKSLIVKVEKY